MTGDDLRIFRNRLPHWRLAGSVYFVTWRTLDGSVALTEGERELTTSTIKYFHGERYRLYALVVMDDHVHVLVQPLGDHELSSIIHGWKSYTANQMQRKHSRRGAVWQKDYLDRIIRSEEDLYEKASYIVNNPRKRWPELRAYPWVEWFEF